ncbi:hypothetical protein JHN49_20885 [Streptomyces sp. MBT57]|nr:hypothetical protein [Streptomyces sp. MBT57]
MIKSLLEQWKAGQEQKRAIEAERWEQEKRWREEDRAARLEKEAEQAQLEAEQEKSDQEARAEEEQSQKEKDKRSSDLYEQLYGVHHDLLDTAGTVSFVQLECHEDTWSYIARQAFGMWQPQWTTSASVRRVDLRLTGSSPRTRISPRVASSSIPTECRSSPCRVTTSRGS